MFSPWTDLAVTGATIDDPAIHDAILTRAYLAECAALYLAGRDARDPRASPPYGIPPELPPILVQVGGDEMRAGAHRDARRCGCCASMSSW